LAARAALYYLTRVATLTKNRIIFFFLSLAKAQKQGLFFATSELVEEASLREIKNTKSSGL
jgi:hypothetical protein